MIQENRIYCGESIRELPDPTDIDLTSEASILSVKELWYVRFEDTKELVIMHIKDITKKTVDIDWIYEKDIGREGRFMISEVNFVEKCTNMSHINQHKSWSDE